MNNVSLLIKWRLERHCDVPWKLLYAWLSKAHPNISGCHFHLIDRQQTSWQSQKPKAPWGGQSREIYEWEDEGCGVEGGENPRSRQVHRWVTLNGEGRQQQQPVALTLKTTTTLIYSGSPSAPSLQLRHCGSFPGRLWSNHSLFARKVTVTNS